MIRLRLQMLAKGGSGSPIGKGEGSEKISKEAWFRAQARAQKSMPRAGGVSDKDISSRENYVLYRVLDEGKTVRYNDRSGRELRDSLADEKLRYDKKLRMFVSQKGYKYVIRKK